MKSDREELTGESRRRRSVTWIGAAVIGALVGSGTTLAMSEYFLQNLAPTPSASVSASSGSATPVSENVTVNDGITNVVKAIEPDVVAVVNYTESSDFLNQSSQPQESDIGSGVLFDKDANYAYVVTNNHVVDGGSKVELVLQSGQHVAAQVVGTDPYTDLAVIKVPVKNFAKVNPVQFANSDNVQVGEPAIAIGTPMGLDFADTVTSGIISGKQRMMPVEEPTSEQDLDYQAVIQTDAAINPGNSGGPLLNIQGQLVGINSSKIVEQDFEGMGFAIPANEVKTIASEIMKTGHAVHPSLGIEGYSLSSLPQQYWPNVPVNYGVYVSALDTANAKNSGLQKGDVIIAVGNQTVQTVADLRTALFQLKPGQTVNITVYRGSQKKTLRATVGSEESMNTTAQAQGQTQQSAPSDGYGSYGSSQGGGDQGGGDQGGFNPNGSDPFGN